MVERIETILAALDVAAKIADLDRPSFRLHALSGDRKGQWSITGARQLADHVPL